MKLKKISITQAKKRGLVEAGKANSENMGHAIYLMNRYCQDREKVKYYTIEIKITNNNTGISRQIVRFWREE